MISFLKRITGKGIAAFSMAILAGYCNTASAQRIALKTNALYWATASPNIGLELRINRHITFDFDATYNNITIGKYDSQVRMFTPEMRYWFSARPQAGHFVGLTGIATNYDMTIDKKTHDGDLFGGGFSYGYSFVLGEHWSLETTIGAGFVYRHELEYRQDSDYRPEKANIHKWQPFPLKAGISFVYIIK